MGGVFFSKRSASGRVSAVLFACPILVVATIVSSSSHAADGSITLSGGTVVITTSTPGIITSTTGVTVSPGIVGSLATTTTATGTVYPLFITATIVPTGSTGTVVSSGTVVPAGTIPVISLTQITGYWWCGRASEFVRRQQYFHEHDVRPV